MEELFLALLQVSLTGSLFILAVMLVRILFRNAPKWLFCLLWGMVALRLICPVSIESKLSLIPDQLASGQIISNAGNDYIGKVDIIYEHNDAYSAALEAGRQPVSSDNGYYVVTRKDSLDEPQTVKNTVYPLLSRVWLGGMVLMLGYTIASYFSLKRKMAEATLLRDCIWQCERVDSPFVLGIIKPKIYLPYQISEPDMENVIAHEQAHIRRRDHWWKPIGFLLLSMHWFNPVMWVAYILLCRDIEAACDEKVIKNMEKDEIRAYSTALLHCSVHRRGIAACPLAFGETGTKERIKRVMNYKKPSFWIILLTIVVTVAAGVVLLTDPSTVPPTETEVPSNDYLLSLVQDIVSNPECSSSSIPFVYIRESQKTYNEILTYGEYALNCYVKELRKGGNDLRSSIMAIACSEITGIGNIYHGADWTTAQEWLALYNSHSNDPLIPNLVATHRITGQQAKLRFFSYSDPTLIACGTVVWEGTYNDEETLVLNVEKGPHQLLLAPLGARLTNYNIIRADRAAGDLPLWTFYNDDKAQVVLSDQGICVTTPSEAGEYYYELQLHWPEKDLTVTYGLKIVMTGEESTYGTAVHQIFDLYGGPDSLISVTFAGRFTLETAPVSGEYYVFEVTENQTKRIAVSMDGKTMYELSQKDGSIIAPIG